MKKRWIIILSIIGLLIILRLIAPSLLLKRANKELGKMDNYHGIVKDVDLRLYKGAYIIDSSYFLKREADFQEAFMAAEKVEIMIDWNALFRHGDLVAFITVINAEINFAVRWKDEEKTEKVKQFGEGVKWLQHFKKLSPMKFNRLVVKDSKITYTDYTTNPQISGYIDSIQINAENLQNVKDKEEALPGDMNMSGITLGGGYLNYTSKVNFVKKPMDININMTLEDMDIVSWNELMKVHTGLDFETGVFNLYTEIKVRNGQINGYVKPVIDNLSLLDWDEEKGSFLDKAWEAISGAVAEVFENQEEDQFASRVPISGSTKDIETSEWTAIWNVFRNAFVDAFNKELEHDIDPGE